MDSWPRAHRGTNPGPLNLMIRCPDCSPGHLFLVTWPTWSPCQRVWLIHHITSVNRAFVKRGLPGTLKKKKQTGSREKARTVGFKETQH